MRIDNYEDVKFGNYVVLKQRGNDRFEDYFTTEKEAICFATSTYYHLTEKERTSTTIEVGIITRIDDWGFDWNPIKWI